MIRYDRKFRTLALCFAALAGFVDAIGFLQSGGLFVSFMSGNSTRLAIGVVDAARVGLAAAGLIALFVLGVVLNVLFGARVRAIHRKVAATGMVAVLLVAAAVAQSLGGRTVPIALLVLAMGASNAIFQRDGDVSIGVTYMTGTLVKLGHRIAGALRGEDRTAWVPYLMLWLALVLGGIAGAAGALWSVTASLWFAAAFAFALTGIVRRLTRDGVA